LKKNYQNADFPPEVTDKGGRVFRIINTFFNVEVSGLIFEVDTGLNKQKDVKNWFSRRPDKSIISFEETNTKYLFSISIERFEDNYFVVKAKYPQIFKTGDESAYHNDTIVIKDEEWVVDGWGGLELWAEEQQGVKERSELLKLLYEPTHNITDMQFQQTQYDKQVLRYIEKKYPSIVSVYWRKSFFFRDGKHYATISNENDSLYIYVNEEEKAEQKRLKKEHDRLYNLYFNLRFRGNKTRMENDLTQEEDRMLMRLLNNSSFRGPVEGTSDTFKNEEDHQTALKLVDKLIKTSRPITESKTEGLKYLKVFKRF
jgi:hypothetical protein